MRRSFELTGMHCQSCVNRIEQALLTIPAVQSATASLEPPAAIVECDGHVDTETFTRAISETGDYQIRESVDAGVGNQSSTEGLEKRSPNQATYYPLIVLVSLIAAVAMVVQFRAETFSVHEFMADFMGGFFVAFAYFKLLDVRGFASAFRRYDVVAERSDTYAMAYPWIELALGAAYLARFSIRWTSAFTLALMLVGTVGVLRSLLASKKIPCACLGTAFKLPMSTVTLVENLGMATMAAFTLLR